MVDELDLLRAFRREIPPPSREAWAKAKEAVTLVAQENPDRSEPPIRAVSGATTDADRQARGAPSYRYALNNRRRAAMAFSIVAVLGLIGGLLVALLGASDSTARSRWEAARPLPGAAPSGDVVGPAGSWHLVGFLTREGWKRNTTGPEPGYLTCATGLVCYVTGDHAASSSGPADFDTLYVTDNGAQSWSALPIPFGVAFTTALSCPGEQTCAAGATEGRRPVIVTTTNGGHSFTVTPLPAGDGRLYALACPTAVFCGGLAATSDNSNGTPTDATFLSTGMEKPAFHDTPFPRGDSMESLSCPSVSDCVAVGTSDRLGVNDWTAGVVAHTTDAGATWTTGALPTGFGINYLSQIACRDASHCFVIGTIAMPTSNPPRCRVKQLTPYPYSTASSPAVKAIAHAESAYAAEAQQKSEAIEGRFRSFSCQSMSDTLISDVASSNDGGLSWTPLALPASAPRPLFSDLACSSNRDCYVSGTVAIAQRFPHGTNGGSAIVLATSNSGTSWKTVTFTVPSAVPNGAQNDAYMTVGDIQCPTANDCIALGVTDQGSRTTPIYTSTRIPPPAHRVA
jgi:hypothetical protein